MKKTTIFIILMTFFAFLSCRNGNEDLQFIDQEIRVYLDSANQDLLNTDFETAYVSVTFNDVLANTDSAPVSLSKKADEDSIFYYSYLAGATRKLVDSTTNYKRYKSEIAFKITKRHLDQSTSIFSDTLLLYYSSTPTLFTVESAYYNDVQVFSKVEGLPNFIKIHK